MGLTLYIGTHPEKLNFFLSSPPGEAFSPAQGFLHDVG
jgi:hypothetical protein